MTTLANLVVRLTGDIGGFDSAMESAGGKIQNFGSQISNVGSSMSSRLTLPIVGTGAAALLMGNQFNAGMANVISLVPEAAGEIGGLRGDVQNLAMDMGQSTTDMTAGLYQVVSAFGYSAESMDLLRIAATAGTAGLATTTDAINLVSAVTRGYGDTSAAAAQQTADLALKTVQLGQTTFPELAASIGRVTPLAANLGVTQQELFAVMASGTGVTGSAAEVSTQLRGVLQSLMAPTSTMTELITSLGYSNGAAMLQGLGLQGSIQAIVGAATASGTPLQSFMGSIEGQTLAMALAGPLAGDYEQKLQAMGLAAGTTDAAFAAQTQGLNAAGFAMQQATTAIQIITQNLGNALGPAVLAMVPLFQGFVAWIQQVIDRFMALDPHTQMVIIGLVGLVAAIGPLLMILGPLVTGLGIVVTAIGALLSPIGLVIAAVVLLAIAVVDHFGGVQATIEAASAFVQGILQGLSTFVSNNQAEIMGWVDQAWAQIQSIVTNIVNGVQAVVTAVLTVVSGFIDAHGAEIQAFVMRAWQQIGTIVNLALTLINEVVTRVLAAVASFIDAHGAEIQAILTAAWNMISSLIQIALNLIEGIIRVALAIIRGDWETAWTEVQTLVINLWTSIQSYIQAALDFVVNLVTLFVNSVIQWFTNLYHELVGGSIIPDMVTAIIEWFTQLGERVAELVQALVTAAIQLFTDLINEVTAIWTELQAGTVRIWTDIKSWLINMWNELKTTAGAKIQQLIDNVLGIFANLGVGMRARGEGMVRAFADGILAALGWALDAARRMADVLRSLLPGSDARTGPLSDLTASGRALPETLGRAISQGAPAAVDAAAGLAGGLAGVLGMDTADLGAQAGISWIEAMIKAIQSRLPALGETTAQAWKMLADQAGPGLNRGGVMDRSEPARPGERGGPITINLNGPWNVSGEMDAQRIAEIVGEVLAGKAVVNKRMAVGWATV
jgi:TP901 family phage tail tape measure protein